MVAQIDNWFWKTSAKKTYTRLLSYLFYEGRPLTTSGQWFNPIVFTLYRLQARLPCARAVEKPVFILGTGRSGTTILGVTLGIHRDVGFLNEPKALWSYLFPREDLIGSYNLGTAHYRLDASDVSNEMRHRANRILGHYLQAGFSKRVVDKYPELIFRVPFVSALYPDACYLFLYRNGYDTCHSIKNWSKRLGQSVSSETHDWWGRNDRKWALLCDQIVANDDVLGEKFEAIKGYQDHVHRAAVEWIVTMKEGLRLIGDQRYPVMAVQYEKYVEDREYRHQVLDFCGLPNDPDYDLYTNQVLKKVRPYQSFDLPSEIADEFKCVMQRLKYDV